MLKDSLLSGRYYFTIARGDRRARLVAVPAGEAELARQIRPQTSGGVCAEDGAHPARSSVGVLEEVPRGGEQRLHDPLAPR